MARPLVALLLAAMYVPPAPAADLALGTLFHTPEERARLDRMRRGEAEPESAVESGKAPAVTGFVKRSDGRHTVWIDGIPVPVATPRDAKTVEALPIESASRPPDVRFERKSSEQPAPRKAP